MHQNIFFSLMLKIQVTFCPVMERPLHGSPSSWQPCLLHLKSPSPPHPLLQALLLGNPSSVTPQFSHRPPFLPPRPQPQQRRALRVNISTSIICQLRTRPGDLRLSLISSLLSGFHSLTLLPMALLLFLCKTPLKSSGCLSRYGTLE